MHVERLVEGIRRGEVAALARAISLVENARDGYEELLSALHPAVGRAHRIGITGPTGVGKSTLIHRLVSAYRDRGVTVGVLAVDPTSPYTGGALLGDRVRMEELTLDQGVYIRSMATRGAVGGLAAAAREVCDVLDAFGFDRIVIETVGVGQSELAIAATADTAVLMLVPESGDGIQLLKAGVMEIADLYAVNKADRPGAERLMQEVEVMLGFRRGQAYRHVAPRQRRPSAGEETWTPPVLATVAINGAGVEPLLQTLEAHYGHLEGTGELVRRRRERLARHTRDVVERTLSMLVWEEGAGEAKLAAALDDVVAGRVSPYRLASEIVSGLHRETSHEA